MADKQRLLTRLDQIAHAFSQYEGAMALLGLGSVGIELDRLDAYSDLDFFAITQNGYKQRFLENLDWMHDCAPIAYLFQNTDDGYKLLYTDGVFCEFAIFDVDELAQATYPEGRVVWQREDAPSSLAMPAKRPFTMPRPTEWILGEALTNLYVGLGREARGETRTAFMFVQNYAVDRVIELMRGMGETAVTHVDIFDHNRRIEQHYPQFAHWFPQFMQGYGQTKASARAILTFLETHFIVNTAMKAEIEQLLF